MYHGIRQFEEEKTNARTTFRTVSFMLAEDMLGSSTPGLTYKMFTRIQKKLSYPWQTVRRI